MAMVDGSVRFVPADFNEDIFRLLITIDDGQLVDFDKLVAPKKTPPAP
jgi:hypothetical protein